MSRDELMPFTRLMQAAYVTNDFNRALRLFAERFAVRRFLIHRGIDVPTGADTQARLDVGLALINAFQIEIIQPRGGADEVFAESIQGPGFCNRLHHLCYQVDDIGQLEGIATAFRGQGVAIVLAGGNDDCRYIYSDHRSTLGHYVEHIYRSPQNLVALREAFAAAPELEPVRR